MTGSRGQRTGNREGLYLNRFALIGNVGASTRIENAVLTDNKIEWVDTTLYGDSKVTAFDEKKLYILDKLSKDKERSIEEVVGCREPVSTGILDHCLPKLIRIEK